MSTVDYLPFAVGGAPNVVDQATYLASASGSGQVADGYQSGLAQSNWLNKTWRQSSMIAAAVAKYVSNVLAIDVLDDGNLANLVTNFTSAIQIGSAVRAIRVVTSSAALSVNANSDYRIMLNRTAGVAAMNVNLAALGALVNGQEFVIEDVAGNGFAAPFTLVVPGGHTIRGAASYVVEKDFGSARVCYSSSGNVWSLALS
jgi:hypothetical protein